MAIQRIDTVNAMRLRQPCRAWQLAARRAHRVARQIPLSAVRPVRTELVGDMAALEERTGDWRELAAYAADANVLFEPDQVLAAMRHLGASCRVLFVWRGNALIGAFPLRPAKAAGLALPGATLHRHLHSFLSTPIVHRDHVAEAASAYADFIATGGAGRFMMHGLSHADGVTAMALKDAFMRHGLTFRAYGAHERACLKSGLSGDDYLNGSLSKKRLKEYRRLRSRLAEKGDLTFEVIGAPHELELALEQFLTLEAAGWKGRRGTAMGSNQSGRRYLEALAGTAGQNGGLQVVRVALDGKPIAMALLLSSGRRAFLWKIAYDEMLAAYSPGVLLILELTRKILNEKLFDMVDSCAIANHPMIDRIWRERVAIEDLVITPSRTLAPAVFAAHGIWRGARQKAKQLIHALRRHAAA